MTNFATPLVVNQMSLAAHMLRTQVPERLAKHSILFPSLGFIKRVMSLYCLGSFYFFIFPIGHKCLRKVTEKEVYNLFSDLQDLENAIREAVVRRRVLPSIPIPYGTPRISQKPTCR